MMLNLADMVVFKDEQTKNEMRNMMIRTRKELLQSELKMMLPARVSVLGVAKIKSMLENQIYGSMGQKARALVLLAEGKDMMSQPNNRLVNNTIKGLESLNKIWEE